MDVLVAAFSSLSVRSSSSRFLRSDLDETGLVRAAFEMAGFEPDDHRRELEPFLERSDNFLFEFRKRRFRRFNAAFPIAMNVAVGAELAGGTTTALGDVVGVGVDVGAVDGEDVFGVAVG